MIPAKIAVVDDEPRMGQILGMVLRRDGHDVQHFTAPADFLAACDGAMPFDLLLTDLRMPGMDGAALMERALALAPELPVILITAYATVETAVRALKQGAYDYLQKPVDNAACRAAVRRALDHTRLARENRHLRAALGDRWGSPVAESPAMRRALELARRAAPSRSTVLITGDSGAGKEVVARYIHAHSDRVGGPFLAVNCKALSEGVLESELFGHEAGAFTGAAGAREGLFRAARGGTLLLDEIGELGLDVQAKLLRVLQEREVTPLGGDRPLPIDVRIVAATNRDLAAEVRAGRFREDLYFRLAVIPVHLPPLRERRADILPLARHLLARSAREQGRRIAGWRPEVEPLLLAHGWPGNVRELANAVERGVVLARGEWIEPGDLMLSPGTGGQDSGELGLHAWLDAAAARRIREVLVECDGVRVEAARRLQIERTTLYRLMKKYGIEG